MEVEMDHNLCFGPKYCFVEISEQNKPKQIHY